MCAIPVRSLSLSRPGSGTDCVGHLLRAATDANPRATVLFVDGIGAYDDVLRVAMLSRLKQMPETKPLIPFAMLSYSEPSTYDWFDDTGHWRTVFAFGRGRAFQLAFRARSKECQGHWRTESYCARSWTTSTSCANFTG